MGQDIKDIRFNEVLFTTYSNDKDMDSAVKLQVDSIFFNSQIGIADNTTVQNVLDCEMILTGSLVNPCISANT